MSPEEIAKLQAQQQQNAAVFAMLQNQGIAPSSPGANPTQAGRPAAVTNPGAPVGSNVSNLLPSAAPTQSYLGTQVPINQGPPNPLQINSQNQAPQPSSSGAAAPGVGQTGVFPAANQNLQAITGS